MDGDLTIMKNQLQNTHNVESQLDLFQKDTLELGKLAAEFITEFFPAYACDNQVAIDAPLENSLDLLNSFTFYKIGECKFYNVEDPFEFFASKMQKLFTTAYSINQEVCYGLVSNGGVVSLVLGIGPTTPDNDKVIPTIMGGLLPGIKLEKYTTKFVNQMDASTQQDKDRYVGCVVGTPALKIDGELQRKDLTSLMRSLNGLDYTIMVMCKPISPMEIQNRISLATGIKDKCFAISKRTISYQNGISVGDTHTEQESVSDSSSIQNSKGSSTGGNVSGALLGAAVGFKIGAIAGTPVPIIGNALGAGAGALVGLIVGSQLTFNHSKTKNKTVGESHSLTKGYSDAITNTINSNKSISGEIQNSFAVELMEMADLAIQRLKSGRGIGMWKSVTSFSSDSEIASKIIQGCLYSEIASGIPEVLPPVVFSYTDSCTQKGCPSSKIHNQQLMIPKDFFANNQDCTSPLCSLVTSEELCAICTIPVDNTVGFEVHCQRPYALNYNLLSNDHPLGVVCEYDRPLPNIPFGLSDSDLYLLRLSSSRIHQLHGRAGPVHLTGNTRLMRQTVRKILRQYEFTVDVTEPTIAIRQQILTFTAISVLFPQQFQGHTRAGKFLVNIAVIRRLIQCLLWVLVRKEETVTFRAGLLFKVRKGNLALLSKAKHFADRCLGHVVGMGNFGLRQSGST